MYYWKIFLRKIYSISGQEFTELNLVSSETFCIIDGGWNTSAGKPTNYEDWAEGQPTADGDCVGISNKDKKMTILDCDSKWPFYCFQDNLVLLKEDKTWEEALEHCRAMDLTDPNNHRNDLISISGPLDQHTV
ncbi:unnamed protein product [Arctogadus glacialis]